jgi:threonine aldolase
LDFRSDTVTKPTEEMRKAMYTAEVGDDVLREDTTTRKLEETAAELLGKEAGLFVVSGTFGNQLALLTHTKSGDEIILSETSHIVQHEVGAPSVIAGANLRTILPQKSYLTWDDIEPRIRRGNNIHFPDTGLIELENALSNGDVQPLASMQAVKQGAAKSFVPVHLDGARIFNAALALNCSAEDIASQADSVMFCLSKGLSAPIGSVLVGDAAFIERARKNRKLMGGGMRQTGVIAAAGQIALSSMRDRLGEDHLHARRMAEAFAEHKDLFTLDMEKVKINMVFVRLNEGIDGTISLEEMLRPYGIITYPRESGEYRFVTHYGITSEDIDYFCSVLPQVAERMRKSNS